MKKIFIISLLAIGVFFAPRFSHAALIVGVDAVSGNNINIHTQSPVQTTQTVSVPTLGSGNKYLWFKTGSNSVTFNSWDYQWQYNCVTAGSADCSAGFSSPSGFTVAADTWFQMPTPATQSVTAGTLNFGVWANGAQPFYLAGDGAGHLAFAWTDDTNPPSFTPPISINFIYPTDNLLTPLFSHLILSGTSLTSTAPYQLTIDYSIPGVTGVKTMSKSISGGQLEQYGTSFPYEPFEINTFATSSHIVAHATLYDLTNFRIPLALEPFIVATSSISFNVITASNDPAVGTTTYLHTMPFFFGGSVGVSTSTQDNPFPLPAYIASSSFYCTAPNNITDIGGGISYGICSASYFLFTPHSSPAAYWNRGVALLEDAFPFSVVFGVHNIIVGVASTTQDSIGNGDTMQISMANVSPAFGSGIQPIVFLSSSTLVNLVGQTQKNNIFSLEDALMWILFALLVYKTVAHGKH